MKMYLGAQSTLGDTGFLNCMVIAFYTMGHYPMSVSGHLKDEEE